MTANTLAGTAVKLVSLVLTREKAAHQCCRIKNLFEEEVVHFVAAWSAVANVAGLEKVRLIVANNLTNRIPERYVAEDGCSITHYRNNNPDGLIYVETSVQSDEQGLQNMFSLQDSNFLDRSFDGYVRSPYGVAGLLIEEAWKGAGGQSDVPAMLLDNLLLVIGFVHPSIESVPVRKYIAFIELACREWRESDRTKDESEANRIVGQALWALGMFPDANWKDSNSGPRTRRRLELNIRHADMLDGGRDVDAEEISERAEATQFKDENGALLAAVDVKHWRVRCSAYGRTPTDAALRREIPYWVYSQLFVRDTTGLRLGDRVRAELERDAPERVAEFDALDVVAGLNGKNSHDANRFLEAAAEGGSKPLADLIEQATRKSVERIAVPPRKRFFNPAIEIVRLVQRVTADAGGSRVGSIRLEVSPEAVGSPSHGLFTFLFGATVKAIAEALGDIPGACSLLVPPHMFDMLPVPKLRELIEPGGDEESESLAWGPLPLRITLSDPAGRVLEVTEQAEWYPSDIEYFALFWLLAGADDSPALNAVATLRGHMPANGDDWMGPLVRRELSLDSLKVESGHVLVGTHALLDKLSLMRGQLRSALRASGLDVATLRSFLDGWQSVLAQSREEFVPDGVRSRELDAFLGCDMLALEREERRIMLPTHPLRLRWICCYLEETRRLAEAFLSGEAEFADGEGHTFLNWVENLTPRESPPLAVGQDGQLLYSRSEIGWFEDFSPERTDSGDVGVDSDAVESIARRIVGYLEAHPYKRDGLSLLVVLPTSDSMPADILERISARSNRSVRVSLYVAAPKARWESIARAVELMSKNPDGGPRARLFPDRDLALFDYQAGGDMTEVLADLQLDVAVVSHALQEQIVSQQNTESPIERPGRFDPLQHRPLRLEIGGGGGSISLVMLPKYPDPMLESWSTLAVRANRCRPVAPSQPENTDFVELRVNFQDSARLFKDLHEHCHWVITLERHISREQIESVEAGSPDVLSIEEGVGANRLSTLVVSSRSGRELAQSRIERKLARLIPQHQQNSSEPHLLATLANAVYDSTRSLSPRLALQALGVARVTEEIVGLTVARRLAEDNFPNRVNDGLAAWLSLDDHTDWFGGHAEIRADMCRISFERDSSHVLNIDVLVLEGKLRQVYDEHGVLQVSRTVEFFKAILGGTEADGAPKVDKAMWHDLIASAIENLPNDAVTLGPATASGTPDEVVRKRDLLLSEFRSGACRLRSVEGVYSACMWQSEDETLSKSVEQDVTVLKSTRVHLLELVRPRDGDEACPSSAVTKEDPRETSRSVPTAPRDSDCCQASGEDVATKSFCDAAPAQVANAAMRSESRVSPAGSTESFVDEASRDTTQSHVLSEGLRRGLPDAELQLMYEKILGCFGTHGISVSAAQAEDQPFVEGPASVLFKIRPGSGVDPRKLSEKASALKLILALSQEQNVSFNIDRGFVTIDVPKSASQRYFVDAAETWSRWKRPLASLAVPLGEDRFGAVVEINFSSPNTPHLLIAGTTGSGKSEALNSILRGLIHYYAKEELRLMLVDPKGTELVSFADASSSYLEGSIGWDSADALELLRRAVTEMEARYAVFKTQRHRSIAEFNNAAALGERLPWWLIVLDEYADLTGDPEAKKSIEAQLKRLAQKARAAGIHVIIATQKPSAEVISTNLRSNLPAQLALRVKSATESRVVMDEAGAENLNGKGDALFKADGRLQRIQCSRVQLENCQV